MAQVLQIVASAVSYKIFGVTRRTQTQHETVTWQKGKTIICILQISSSILAPVTDGTGIRDFTNRYAHTRPSNEGAIHSPVIGSSLHSLSFHHRGSLTFAPFIVRRTISALLKEIYKHLICTSNWLMFIRIIVPNIIRAHLNTLYHSSMLISLFLLILAGMLEMLLPLELTDSESLAALLKYFSTCWRAILR